MYGAPIVAKILRDQFEKGGLDLVEMRRQRAIIEQRRQERLREKELNSAPNN
jgi:hypothetical protein